MNSVLKKTAMDSKKLVAAARAIAGENASASRVWSVLHRELLSPSQPFHGVHEKCYEEVYSGIDDVKPAWIPSKEDTATTNIARVMAKKGFKTYEQLYDWSISASSRDEFWMESANNEIGIDWDTPPTAAFDVHADGPAHGTTYFPGGRLNISDSVFNKRDPMEPALVYSAECEPRTLREMSFGTLEVLSNRIAHSITNKLALGPGDAVGICMPMTPESVAIYLGIVKAGCVVVSIADSFSAAEIATRCRISGARAVFTQDVIYRGGGKFLPLFQRVLDADRMLQKPCATRIVVLPGMLHANPYRDIERDGDGSTWTDKDGEGKEIAIHDSVLSSMNHDAVSWYAFLDGSSKEYTSVKRSAMDPCNILFSSGTTGEPKAIVWSHSTPIKSAVDGYYHHDIRSGERVAWPTNIGWMMGPWLLFQLLNGATVCLFNGVFSAKPFCEFVDEARVSMLGVIPSLVKSWRAANATEHCDWSSVRRFSSTGEASDPTTAHWLMSRVPGYAPVLEYCGGTEIGGSFLSSTMVQNNVPSMFSTPVLGSQLFLLSAEDQKVIDRSAFRAGTSGAESGEVVLVPPAVGLSTTLLNRDHYAAYYEGMPPGPGGEVLRRHGDEVECVRNNSHRLAADDKEDQQNSLTTPYFRALGRSDDTMNIGGIKVGSVEIETVCNLVENVLETAAIAVSGTKGGPSRLVLYVVLENKEEETPKDLLKSKMQNNIKTKLNPLFRISDVVIAASLPRTASNKVMRRVLRDEYVKATSG